MPKIKVEETNGLIPVKYEDCDVTYDIKSGEYFAVIRIGLKKIGFQQINE